MGSAGLDIIMSFLWIALSLSSLLLTPSLSSISPILRHIDNNNQEGPHFRSFLVPSSLRSVTTHLVQTIPSSELQKTSLSPKNILQSHPSLSVPEISHPNLSVSVISHHDLSVSEISHHDLSVSEISHHDLYVSEISHPSLSAPELSHTNSLENLEIIENPQLTRNSLETFTVELHPEEELARSG